MVQSRVYKTRNILEPIKRKVEAFTTNIVIHDILEPVETV